MAAVAISPFFLRPPPPRHRWRTLFRRSPASVSCANNLGVGGKVFEDMVVVPRGIKDYIDLSRDLNRPDGGPPRWFSPVECGGSKDNTPLLLYLPGIDGTGAGLIRHHQRLGKIFDVWCLHIPVVDRTPFEGLVEYVEIAIKYNKPFLGDKPIYLVGESIGACVALAVAEQNPDIDLILLIANPATSFLRSKLWQLATFLDAVYEPLNTVIPSSIKCIAGNSMEMAINYAASELSLQQPSRGLLRDLSDMMHGISFLGEILPSGSIVWKLNMLRCASYFVNSRLHAVKAQTLILSSGRDQLFPSLEEAKRLCKLLPNCRIRKFGKCGHNIFLEDGMDLVTTLKATCYYRRSQQHDYLSDYLLPTPDEYRNALIGYRWVDIAASPVMLSTLQNGKIIRGLEGIPFERPTLLVGNHMLLGMELGTLATTLMFEKGIPLRGIAHPLIFDKDFEQIMPDHTVYDGLRIVGAVQVSATNFYRLFHNKALILVYPGGLREALHRKGEEYKLFWPEQAEFVRMASKFGATIVPFGVIGEDDVCEMIIDYEDIRKLPFYDIIDKKVNTGNLKLRSDSTNQVGDQNIHPPMMLPKIPGRFYFLFGKPIQTRGRKEELRDKEKAHHLYMHVKSEIENCIAYLKNKREKDPYRHVLPRFLYQLTNGFKAEIPTFEL